MVIRDSKPDFGGDVAELADAQDLKSCAITMAYEFDPRHPHQTNRLKISLDHLPVVGPLQIALLFQAHLQRSFHLSTGIHKWESFNAKSRKCVSFMQYSLPINRLNITGGLE